MCEIVTQWFSGKPERPGVWEMKHPTVSDLRVYQYWDGQIFYAYARDAELAKRNFDKQRTSFFQVFPHRGLADNPAEGSAP